MKERKDIDKQYTWDLEVIYSSSKEFEDDYNKVKDMIQELSKYENNMMDSNDNFYKTISLSFDIERIIDKLYSYTSLSFDLDTSNNECQELCEKISNLHSDYVKVIYCIVPGFRCIFGKNRYCGFLYKDSKRSSRRILGRSCKGCGRCECDGGHGFGFVRC